MWFTIIFRPVLDFWVRAHFFCVCCCCTLFKSLWVVCETALFLSINYHLVFNVLVRWTDERKKKSSFTIVHFQYMKQFFVDLSLNLDWWMWNTTYGNSDYDGDVGKNITRIKMCTRSIQNDNDIYTHNKYAPDRGS